MGNLTINSEINVDNNGRSNIYKEYAWTIAMPMVKIMFKEDFFVLCY